MADEEVKKKSSIIPTILIIAAIIVVDIVGGYFLGNRVLIPLLYPTDEVESTESDTAEADLAEAQGAIPLFTKSFESINLNPSNSAGEIFSCQLTLVAESQAVIDEMTSREPQIRDIILSYLSFKAVVELNDVTKREEMKKDIMERVSAVLTSGMLLDIYIVDWIIQFN